jgi:integral membrane sensor domain MASE1
MTRAIFARFVSEAFTAAVMSGAVAAAMLTSIGGLTANIIERWIGRWGIGLAIALPVGIVIAPLAERLRQRLQGPEEE